MDYLHWASRPTLQNPIIIAAFAGWNDAGEAASSAIRHLANQWNSQDFATIDSEDFYDFSVTRPMIRLHDGVSRDIEWPTNRIAAAHAPGEPARDVVLLLGVEPQLKWRTFCSTILQFAESIDATALITLGALLADVPHTRQPHVSGSASSASLFNRLSVKPSQYEGPTGIIGALQQTATENNFPSASLWVPVPHYVAHIPSPKATLALVERLTSTLGTPTSLGGIESAALAYEQQVDEIVEMDEDLRGYITQLEDSEDDEGMGADLLAEEAERYLREQGA